MIALASSTSGWPAFSVSLPSLINSLTLQMKPVSSMTTRRSLS